MSGEVRRRIDGFETWSCCCGARGLGGEHVLAMHKATHPLVRIALGRALRKLAIWVDRLGVRALTLYGGGDDLG